MNKLKITSLVMISMVVFAFAEEDTSKDINSKLGISIFGKDDIWNKPARELALTIGIPLLSSTDYCDLYAANPKGQIKILGVEVFYAALYASNDKPKYMYIVFSNKSESAERKKSKSKSIRKEISRDYQRLGGKLTEIFGKDKDFEFGSSFRDKEKAHLWIYKDTAFILSCPRDELVVLRIMPAALLEKQSDLLIFNPVNKDILKKRVSTNEFGDMVISQMLMVDQGVSGYCVPAACERILRYYGINTEFYSLSTLMRTCWGGGTYMDDMTEIIRLMIMRVPDLKIEKVPSRLSIKNITEQIENGYPIMWVVSRKFRKFNCRRKRKPRVIAPMGAIRPKLMGPYCYSVSPPFLPPLSQISNNALIPTLYRQRAAVVLQPASVHSCHQGSCRPPVSFF